MAILTSLAPCCGARTSPAGGPHHQASPVPLLGASGLCSGCPLEEDLRAPRPPASNSRPAGMLSPLDDLSISLYIFHLHPPPTPSRWAKRKDDCSSFRVRVCLVGEKVWVLAL